MVILGAGGHADEILDVLSMKYPTEELFLFDNTGGDTAIDTQRFSMLLESSARLAEIFQKDNSFCIGVGKPSLRKKMIDMALSLGGKAVNAVAQTAYVSPAARIGSGLNIMHMAYVSPGASVSDGVLINAGALIHHDVFIDNYVEISPGASLLGGAHIAPFARIGSRAVILPNISIGTGAVVGAGAVVTRDVRPGEVVVGIPAKTQT